jgi:hypothetical protein
VRFGNSLTFVKFYAASERMSNESLSHSTHDTNRRQHMVDAIKV